MLDFNTYPQGDLVRVSGVYSAVVGGAALDPTNVFLSVRDPAGTLTTYTYGIGVTITKDSTGNYHSDISANLPGWWYYRWFSTGTGQGADEKRFKVKAAHAI